MLPIVLAAQIQPSQIQPPQARLPVGFPGPSPATSATPPSAAPGAAPASLLPATPVTQIPVATPATPAVPLTPAQNLAHRATVTYVNGRVTVKAHNSSLNQILRALMRETGLQIDGGVVEERVYGTYGPARLSTLLSNLLSGTGSDIIYTPALRGQTAHLTLTSRDGKTAPPPPSASASDDLLPDGPADDPVPIKVAMAPGPQIATVNSDDLPVGTYPVQVEPPHVRVTSLPPTTVDQVYQQILQLHTIEQKMAQDQKAAAARAAASPGAPAPPPVRIETQTGPVFVPAPAPVAVTPKPVARE